MRMVIIRDKDDGIQTLGRGLILDGTRIVREFCTLELPWRDNQKRISCIPAGRYLVTQRFTKRFKKHFLVTDVIDRTGILIHVGNFHTQVEGCILPGSHFSDINDDGLPDVVNSRATLDVLVELMPKMFTLDVVAPIE